MKSLLTLTSFLIFVACNDNSKVSTTQFPPEKSAIVVIKLVDSLGNVTMSLPTRYDTSYVWTHYSDCGISCDKIKYRLQSKTLPITKESGFIWHDDPKDSIDRFTIVHSGYFPFKDNIDSSSIFIYHKNRKKEFIQSPETYQLKSDTVEKIGDRYYSIITVDLYDTSKRQYSKILSATTTIKSNVIEFKFELLTKKTDSITTNFLSNSLYFLRTIRLSNGK